VTPETLSRAESVVISRLREVPTGALYDELVAAMCDLIAFVHDPRCTRAQADGVPCELVDISCEDCRDVAGVLAGVRCRLCH
jgi:hypothetical protein